MWVKDTLFYRSEAYRKQTIGMLDRHAYPIIGNLPLGNILPADVLRELGDLLPDGDDDAIWQAARLAALDAVPPRVIGVDDQPTTEREVLDWIAARLGLPSLPDLPGAASVSGKRLRNDLSRSLGWRPRYASYRDGYTSELPGTTRP